jgi:hypothetical protein
MGGANLIRQHNHSTSTLLSTVYPDYNWLPWKFDKCPNFYWNDFNNHKKFIEWAAQQLKIKEMSDWYNVTVKDLYDIGGASLITTQYKGSPTLLLFKVYPDYNWLPWKFAHIPRNYWRDMKNQRKFVNWAETQLSIKETSNWYKVTIKVLICVLYLW